MGNEVIEGMVDRCGIRLLESELVVVVWSWWLYGNSLFANKDVRTVYT